MPGPIFPAVVDVRDDLVREFIEAGKNRYEFAFEPHTDLLYEINDMHCLMIVGGFELKLVYDRVKEPFWSR